MIAVRLGCRETWHHGKRKVGQRPCALPGHVCVRRERAGAFCYATRGKDVSPQDRTGAESVRCPGDSRGRWWREARRQRPHGKHQRGLQAQRCSRTSRLHRWSARLGVCAGRGLYGRYAVSGRSRERERGCGCAPSAAASHHRAPTRACWCATSVG